ncbi:MAG: hypothetical protein NTV71_03605 [Candidatus Omnitrophica bacterium]|nr:hypothetical protein [Candidatus Omnitrophota bacterium]
MPQKRKDLKISGPDLWYLVGLIASDGCLSSDGRHIDITSKDFEFLSSIKQRYGFTNKIGNKYNTIGQLNYHLQLANRSFYEFLLSIGLTPRKSLVIESVNVSSSNFCDFLRGLIDGDGGIQKWIHHSNRREQWNLRIASGSKKFLIWIQNEIEKIIEVKGKLYAQGENIFVLKYGKMAARIIANKCYYENCFGLRGKVKLALECINSYKGWERSKTIEFLKT